MDPMKNLCLECTYFNYTKTVNPHELREHKGLKILITFVYGRNTTPSKRRTLWSVLCDISQHTIGKIWIVSSDFNEVFHLSKRNGPGEHSDAGPAEFRAMIDHMNLSEMYMKGARFTWSNGSIGNVRRESCIDRVLINATWLAQWPAMICHLYEGGSSDHSAMEIRLHPISKPKRPFRFMNSWLQVGGYVELIKKWWEAPKIGSYMYQFNQKLKLVKHNTKTWPRSQTTTKDQIATTNLLSLSDLSTKISDDPSNVELHKQYYDLKQILFQQQEREECEIKQRRSRTNWLRLSDSNTTFFRRMVKEQSLRNSLLCNLDPAGNSLTTREQLAANRINYFKELFRERTSTNASSWFPRLVSMETNS